VKITDVQTFIVGNPWKNWVFLKLHTDADIYGVGEATTHRRAKMAEAGVIEMRRYYLGRDPFSIEEINEEFSKINAPPFVKAAVDMACWDIMGKALGQPVYQLLGGKFRDRVPAYANGWYQVDRTPEAFAAKALEVTAKGYRAMKFDPFGSVFGEMSSEEIELSIAIVGAVREAVGQNVSLYIEAHGRFDPLLGVQIGRRLEPFEPGWFEEPVRSPQMDDLATIASKLSIPIAAGEGLSGKEQFLDLLNKKAAQIIQPDPIPAGGITEVKKICAIAQAHHVRVAPHNAQGPVCTAACLHIDASTPNVMTQEVFEDFATPFAEKIVDYPIEIVDGDVLIPDRPGLGLDLIEEEMAKYPYDESHFLDLYGKGGWEKRNL
jgi:galactonate dehydratase